MPARVSHGPPARGKAALTRIVRATRQRKRIANLLWDPIHPAECDNPQLLWGRSLPSETWCGALRAGNNWWHATVDTGSILTIPIWSRRLSVK